MEEWDRRVGALGRCLAGNLFQHSLDRPFSRQLYRRRKSQIYAPVSSGSRDFEERCHGKFVLVTTSGTFAPFVISSCAPMMSIRSAILLFVGDAYRLLSAIFVAGFSVAGQGTEMRKKREDDGEKEWRENEDESLPSDNL